MSWKKEIYVVEDSETEERFEVIDKEFLPDEECEIAVYQLKEVKKLRITKTLE